MSEVQQWPWRPQDPVLVVEQGPDSICLRYNGPTPVQVTLFADALVFAAIRPPAQGSPRHYRISRWRWEMYCRWLARLLLLEVGRLDRDR